jgi:hypothetical protein
MTVSESLLDSCGTIIIRQRISLRYHTQNNTFIDQRLEENYLNFSFYSIDIGHQSDHIRIL